MHPLSLGYVFNALEPAEQKEFEELLSRDEELRNKVNLLRRCQEPLASDVDHLEPPPSLALRTCQYLRDCADKPRLAPVTGQVDGVAGRASGLSAWSFHDLAVAAGILVAATLLFLPALNHSRQQARNALCQNHLREAGVALQRYAESHAGFFPRLATTGRLAFAGMYGVRLKESGYLADDRILLCPCCKLCDDPNFRVPTEAELLAASGEEYEQKRRHAGGSYGYNLGQLSEGQLQPVRNLGRDTYALLADSPNPNRDDRCSERHGSCGQNVLYESGRVAYLKTAIASPQGDHLFRNAAGKIAPGVDADDAVIVPSADPLDRLLSELEDEF